MKKLIFTSILFTLIFTASISAKDFGGWKTSETDHFQFIYEEAAREAAEEYALYADEAWNAVSKIYAFPQEKTKVFITDRTNTVNAFTYSAPVEMVMFTTPYVTPDFGFRDNWKKLFFTHELIHVANMKFEGKSDVVTKIMGPSAYSFFNLGDIPGWALEGLTTVLETELTKGGRGRSPYFELMYKAPTIDNAFISYSEIGTEMEPPAGQAYVMGYLIMRSIADRWGIQALADIERNRNLSNSWEESVRLVTGCTAADIYKDAKISLAKKYVKERTISEGVTLSPRDNKFYYYNPAIVLEDGSFITIKNSLSGAAVVRFDPSARYGTAWYSDTKPEKDLNTLFKQTILFTGSFSDQTAITADVNGKVYASMAIERKDRNPGYEVEYALYSFTEKEGVRQLTNGVSLFQPSVSRDGKTLVAVQQKGSRMTLVQVDISSGEVTPLLEGENLNFVQPCVNDDGTKVAFLVTDDVRAKVAVYDLKNKPAVFQVVANDSGTITDPAYPKWNSDGKLTYSCNTRGRLEVFEINEERGYFSSKPVVSDPIGALWAYKTNRGIYYASYASTGNVIKMKPLSEWGKVPDFNGPSMPGEIITFGKYASDYPDFKPFDIPSEKEVSKEDYEKKAEVEEGQPVPVKGKYIEHRSEELAEKAKNLEEGKTELGEEKKYIPGIVPLLYIPSINFQSVPESNKDYFGFGYTLVASTPRLQNDSGIMLANFNLFPGLLNFDVLLGGLIPIGDSTLAFWISRNLKVEEEAGLDLFKEKNSLTVGYTKPIIHVLNRHQENDLEAMASVHAAFIRSSATSFNMFKKVDNAKSLSAQIGVDYSNTTTNEKDVPSTISLSAFGIALWSFDYNKIYFGIEGEYSQLFNWNSVLVEINARTRYTPFPAAERDFLSRASFSDETENCEYPGKLAAKLSLVLPNFLIGLNGRLYGEMLASFGRNNVDFATPDYGNIGNFTFADKMNFGLELGLSAGRTEIYGGCTLPLIFDSSLKGFDKFGKVNFYFNCKIDWLRM